MSKFSQIIAPYTLEQISKHFQNFIDTTPRIAKTLYFALSGVDCLQGKGLSYVFWSVFIKESDGRISGVDLAAKILTG